MLCVKAVAGRCGAGPACAAGGRGVGGGIELIYIYIYMSYTNTHIIYIYIYTHSRKLTWSPEGQFSSTNQSFSRSIWVFSGVYA